MIALWNSSSRTPRGMRRKASYLPVAMPARRPAASVRKRSQWAVITRRAVGTFSRSLSKQCRTSASGSTDSLDEHRDRAAVGARCRAVVCRASWQERVTRTSYSRDVAGEPGEQLVGVLLGDEDDGGTGHGSSLGADAIGLVTVRLRLDLAYDGTDFRGWATQPGLRTVQGELQGALATVLRLRVGLGGLRRSHRRRGPRARPGGARRPRRGARHGAAAASAQRDPAGRRAGTTCGRRPGRLRRPVLRARRRYAYRIADTRGRRRPARARLRARLAAAAGRARDERRSACCWSGATTSRPSASSATGATTIRTLLELSWSRDETGLAGRRPCAPTPSATAWCAPWSAACSSVGEGRRPVAWAERDPARASARPGGDRRARPRADPRGGRLPADDELAARAVLTRAKTGAR